VAPSANLSGRPSPTTWQAVEEDLSGRIDCVLRGEATEVGLESTVLDCSGETPLVLRAGAVTLEELQTVVPETRLYQARDHEPARSPGLKHRHYSPRAKVVLVDAPSDVAAPANSAYIGLSPVDESHRFHPIKINASVEEYAHYLFQFFRECDSRGIARIYCQRVTEQGIGLALMDRLKRAAQG
jgi:L-threonylcarbamoyladenylate synthase